MQNFLSRILPPIEPQKNICSLRPCYFLTAIDRDKRFLHREFFRPDEAVAIARADFHGLNTYIAPASYKDGVFGRKAVNAMGVKALWADIDVGKERNSYATLEDAVQALGAYAKATGCRPTVVVHSGMGLQAYWTFNRAIDAEVWKQLAEFFKASLEQNGVAADPARTTDVASVMRLPGTLHVKSGRTASVIYDNGWDYDPKDLFQKIYASLKAPLAAPPAAAPQGSQGMANTVAVAAMISMGPQPLSAKAEPVCKGCACMLTAGLGQEPQWFAAMSVLKCCVDGREWAHKISELDQTRYVPADTDAKFDHAAENMPAKCVTFEALRPQLCASCPHKGKITSPIQLSARLPKTDAVAIERPVVEQGEAPVTEVVDRLVIPKEYQYPLIKLVSNEFSIDERGIIFHTAEKDSQGFLVQREHLMCTTQLYYTHSVLSFVDSAPRRTHWFVAIHANGKREKLPFVIQRDMAQQNIMRWFYEANIFPVNSGIKAGLFMSFMNTYLQSVFSKSIELATVKKFGWTTVHDEKLGCDVEGFAVGTGVVTETGMKDVAFEGVAQRLAREELDSKGTLAGWRHMANMYKTLDQKAGQLAVCLSFAAPLMKYAPGISTSGVFSLWSKKSGLGKSNVMRVCASIWGNPDKQFIQRNSSAVLRMRKLSTLHNLPCYMDELTDVKDEDLYALAYTLVDGREKQKLRSSGAEMVETGDWQTVIFTTANKSFKEAAARHAGDSEASIIRVMEFECDFKSYNSQPDIRTYINYCIDQCRDNYGIAGPEFLYHILKNRDRLATLTRVVDKWAVEHEFTSDERYVSSALALAIIAGRWAKEWGIIDYDMDALEQWALGVFMKQNRQVNETVRPRHEKLFIEYLMERQLNTLYVRSHERDYHECPEAIKGAPDKYVISYPIRETYVRLEDEEGLLYVAASDLANWCKNRKVSMSVMLSCMNDVGIGYAPEQRSLSHGIGWMCLPHTMCYRFEVDKLKEIGYVGNVCVNNNMGSGDGQTDPLVGAMGS